MGGNCGWQGGEGRGEERVHKGDSSSVVQVAERPRPRHRFKFSNLYQTTTPSSLQSNPIKNHPTPPSTINHHHYHQPNNQRPITTKQNKIKKGLPAVRRQAAHPGAHGDVHRAAHGLRRRLR